ncbi:hypothetical protein WJX73_001490 [Symbiochloris irregularis]|uniref:Thioredoxin domain-containing protein n=1 Tax=Symbiochloris irregularis TaxID=706552 RepID=A0AAW1NU91_9CHLO
MQHLLSERCACSAVPSTSGREATVQPLVPQRFRPGGSSKRPICDRSAVIAAGILDSYRREQGIAVAEPPQKAEEPIEEEDDDWPEQNDDEVCTANCVREVHTAKQFDRAIASAPAETLVIVDFYRTACGSCKYISNGFVKLCMGSHAEHEPVQFLKHNVYDEAEEFTELGERLRIKVVPSFYFYKGGQLVDQFATRDRQRIAAAINKHLGDDVAGGEPVF